MRSTMERTRPSSSLAFFHQGVPLGQAFVEFADFVVKIEDGGVEGLLGGKVTEDDGLGDSCSGSDFFGGGAFEALLGEEIERRFEELATAVGGGEAGEWQTSRPIVSQYLLTVN